MSDNREYTVEREKPGIRESNIEHFMQHFCGKREGVRPHIHPAVEILHVKEGDFAVYVDGREHRLTQGDTVLIRSNAIHRVSVLSDRGGGYYVMKFKPDFLYQLADRVSIFSYLSAFSLVHIHSKTVWHKDEGEGISQAVAELEKESEGTGFGSDIAVRLAYAKVILTLLRAMAAGGSFQDMYSDNLIRRIYDATVYINDHYGEDISARDCSERVFLSYSYFSRNFKRIMGRTFTEYLTATRLNHAENALLSTEKPVSQIAEECGFSSFAYFSALYKREKGTSPTRARERL